MKQEARCRQNICKCKQIFQPSIHKILTNRKISGTFGTLLVLVALVEVLTSKAIETMTKLIDTVKAQQGLYDAVMEKNLMLKNLIEQ